MTWAEDTAPPSPLSAHLEWPSAEGEEAEYSEEGAPPVRRFFLGQLPDDQADGAAEDEQPGWNDGSGDRPAGPSDDVSDFEGFELPAWTGSADLDQALDEDAPHLDHVATLDPELSAPATSHADDERPLASAEDDPTSIATRPVPLAGGRETGGAAPEQPGRGLRSRIAIVAAVVVLLVGTAVYVGTRAKAEDRRGRPPATTSVGRQSTSTTGTTAGSSEPAPDTEPAPASNAAPGSAAPASRPGAPQGSGSSQTRAPATGTAGTTSPPPAYGGPNASPPSPPASPPTTAPNPICRITPNLCP